MSVMDGIKFWLGKQLAGLGFTLAVLAIIIVIGVIHAIVSTRGRRCPHRRPA